MEQGAAVHFEKGVAYTRRQIQQALGGSSRSALPTRGGRVVCVCLTQRKNPRAPQEMVVDGTGRAARLARGFATSGDTAPVFVRAVRGGWEYQGVRRVSAIVEHPGDGEAALADGASQGSSFTLLLAESVTGGAGVGCARPAPAAAAWER